MNLDIGIEKSLEYLVFNKPTMKPFSLKNVGLCAYEHQEADFFRKDLFGFINPSKRMTISGIKEVYWKWK